jgi:hypothetical protein
VVLQVKSKAEDLQKSIEDNQASLRDQASELRIKEAEKKTSGYWSLLLGPFGLPYLIDALAESKSLQARADRTFLVTR